MQSSVPHAPTFASLGASSSSLSGTLGTLAQGPQQQQQQLPPPQQPPRHPLPSIPLNPQRLSSAVPASAYLMQPPSQLIHVQQSSAQGETSLRRTVKKDDANAGLVLPLHKVKKMIKSENSVKAVSGEASFAIARATELVIEHLTAKAHDRMTGERRTVINYDDISSSVKKWPAADFLRDIVPETMTLNELIAMVEREDGKPAGESKE